MFTTEVAEETETSKNCEVIRAMAPECTLEPQDFRKNDTGLIYTCYRSPFADVLGVDLKTGASTVYRRIPDEYHEVEGIFPDGEHALVARAAALEDSLSSRGPQAPVRTAAGSRSSRAAAGIRQALGTAFLF